VDVHGHNSAVIIALEIIPKDLFDQ